MVTAALTGDGVFFFPWLLSVEESDEEELLKLSPESSESEELSTAATFRLLGPLPPPFTFAEATMLYFVTFFIER